MSNTAIVRVEDTAREKYKQGLVKEIFGLINKAEIARMMYGIDVKTASGCLIDACKELGLYDKEAINLLEGMAAEL